MTEYCQNRLCHYNNTQDRLRQKKSDKPYYINKKASEHYFDMFCSQGCMHVYFKQFAKIINSAVGEQGKKSRLEIANLWGAWQQHSDYNLDWNEGYAEARMRFNIQFAEQNDMT